MLKLLIRLLREVLLTVAAMFLFFSGVALTCWLLLDTKITMWYADYEWEDYEDAAAQLTMIFWALLPFLVYFIFVTVRFIVRCKSVGSIPNALTRDDIAYDY